MLGYINVSETYLKKKKTIKTILDNEVVQTGLTFFFFWIRKSMCGKQSGAESHGNGTTVN